jgi:hypothetical protein
MAIDHAGKDVPSLLTPVSLGQEVVVLRKDGSAQGRGTI